MYEKVPYTRASHQKVHVISLIFLWSFLQMRNSGKDCIECKTAYIAELWFARICNLARKQKCLVCLGNCPVPPHSLPSLHLKLQKWILKLKSVEVYHSISSMRDFVVFDRPLSQSSSSKATICDLCVFCNYWTSELFQFSAKPAWRPDSLHQEYLRRVFQWRVCSACDLSLIWFVQVDHPHLKDLQAPLDQAQRERSLTMHWLSRLSFEFTNCEEALKTWATRRSAAIWRWHELARKMYTWRRCAGDSRTVPGFASPNCWKPTLTESFEPHGTLQIDGSDIVHISLAVESCNLCSLSIFDAQRCKWWLSPFNSLVPRKNFFHSALASWFLWGGIPSPEQAITSCKYKLPTELRTTGRCVIPLPARYYMLLLLQSIQVGNQRSESKGWCLRSAKNSDKGQWQWRLQVFCKVEAQESAKMRETLVESCVGHWVRTGGRSATAGHQPSDYGWWSSLQLSRHVVDSDNSHDCSL